MPVGIYIFKQKRNLIFTRLISKIILIMGANTFKIALRTLRKNKLYTFINVLGLTIGIAAALLIFRMVSYELSFNKKFENYDKIGRVVSFEPYETGDEAHDYCLPLPAMELIKTDVPQFELSARIYETWSNITIPNPTGGAPLKKFNVESRRTAMFVDPDFLKIFNYELLSGDKHSVLAEPYSIVLTKTWAEKCFDDWETAIGKTVMIDNLIPVKVTGVLADLPTNTDFSFPYLITYTTLEQNQDSFFYGGGWSSCSSNNQLFARLKDDNQLEAANEVLATIGAKEYMNGEDKQGRVHVLQPLSTLHYDDRYGNSGTHMVSKSRLKILAFIGLLILIIACFNFINLATAQATLRAKEVGVRKTLGSRPVDLIGQFMAETGVIVLIAVVLGANLATLAAPLLKHVSDVPDSISFLGDPQILAFLAITGLVVTLLSGIYPAFKLSRFKPVEALKSKVSKESFGGVSLRKGLVITQFVIAQALIIGAIITINQLDFMRSKDLGFSKDLVYTFGFNGEESSISRLTALKQNILQVPEVENVSFSSDQPLSGNTWYTNFYYSSRPDDEDYPMAIKLADEDYETTYGLELIAGKWLQPSDTMRECVVNAITTVKLGINDPLDIIGQTIKISGRDLTVVGVLKDFHTHSLHKEHEPTLISTRKKFYSEAGVKIRSGQLEATVAAIKAKFDAVFPEQVFIGRFYDERIARFYEDDARMSAMCKGFGLLAILISCLGLFGLATHSANQRIKEIGIRKVLGASIPGIIGLLSKDFLMLVLIALVMAGPLAYMAMNEWLNNFQFRVDIQWSVFVIAGLMAMLIAFLTIVYQAVRAAMSNPIKALKSE